MAMLLVPLCGLLAYGIYLVTLVAQVSSRPLSISGLTADSDGRTNVLLLGVGDPGHDGQNLSDSIMLLSLSSSVQRAAQVSIPRDLRVTIPGYGESKINAANARGGASLAVSVVSGTTNQLIDYTITTDFSGLKTIVDVAGGLDINVKERLTDSEYPCDDDQYKICGLDILPGLQHMTGTQVLAYARCRKGTCGNDFGRAKRQQEVISLLRARVVQPGFWLNPAKLSALARAMHQFVQTDMSSWQLVEFAWRWNSYSSKHPVKQLVLSTAPDGLLVDATGSSDLLPAAGDFSVIQRRIADIFTDSE